MNNIPSPVSAKLSRVTSMCVCVFSVTVQHQIILRNGFASFSFHEIIYLARCRAFAFVALCFGSECIRFEWSGSAIVILALIYCHLYVHFCDTFKHRHKNTKSFKVAHWTITTWLYHETSVAYRCDTKPIHKLNANPTNKKYTHEPTRKTRMELPL